MIKIIFNVNLTVTANVVNIVVKVIYFLKSSPCIWTLPVLGWGLGVNAFPDGLSTFVKNLAMVRGVG